MNEINLSDMNWCKQKIDQLQAENARLREELAAAQADAKRYRWLREHPQYMGWEHDFRADEIDAAIDDAIAKENGK